jgi:hypothetical protein
VATSLDELKARLEAVYAATRRSREQLRDLHRYVHKFMREEKVKNVDLGSAVALLQLLHADAFPEHVPSLADFLQGHAATAKRGVSLDEWAMMLNFCAEVSPDCADYQDDGAWPLLLDDYVEWYRERHS